MGGKLGRIMEPRWVQIANHKTIKQNGEGPGQGHLGNLAAGEEFGPLQVVLDDGEGKYITGIFPSKVYLGQTAFVTLWCRENKEGLVRPRGVAYAQPLASLYRS